LGFLVPTVIFVVCQVRVRSFWDLNNAVIGLLYSLISAAVFQVFLKWLIGGLRPHFLDVCKPKLTPGQANTGIGFGGIMYNREICTGDQDQIDDSLESFPSGHSTAAFAGFIFLYLYLNAKLKVFANYHPAFWKLIVTYMPVLGATLIAGALTIDEFHNWYDCLAGAVIGTLFAFSSYRMVYASVWDFRFNHVPLVRDVPFTYGAAGGLGGFHDAIFTRKVGWGLDEGVMGGAPGDATALGGGSGASVGGGGAFSGASRKHEAHGLGQPTSTVPHNGVRGEQMV
jgi:diacylglycerol diphosphate phosphatase/phosphatidate phosphatase